MGNPLNNLKKAIIELGIDSKIVVEKTSSFYESSAWGYESTKKYVNCCLEASTYLSPIELLIYTQKVEKKLGRIIKNDYQDRTIDIDILFFNDYIINKHNLSIPHPHWQSRNFVINPLLDILDTIKINGETISILNTKIAFDKANIQSLNQINRLK